MVTDLLARLADIGPLAVHALVADDSHRKVVNCHPMVLTAHDLRRHIARRARGVLCVVWVPDPRYTQVRDPHVALLIKHEVLGLDVPVEDALAVEELET